MIVSASVNADVPAHHGAWFMQRLAAGYCCVARLDGLQYRRVPLTRDAVDGFVFWTRCVEPFVPCLIELRRRGFAFSVQFAITGYPRPLAPAPADAARAAAQLARLAHEFGPRVAVWRYDPLLVTSETPSDWHLANFERLAQAIAGATDEAVVAFARFRRKPRGTASVAPVHLDPEPEQKRALVRRLAEIARGCGMRLTLCAQPEWLAPGAAPARCIDAQRLAELARRPVITEVAGFLPGCLCARSIDIGDRDSAAAGSFCGVLPRKEGRHAHDPGGEFLFPPARRFACAHGEDLPF